MNNTTGVGPHGLSTGFVITQFLLFGVSSHLAITGNILLLVTVYKRHALHRVTYYLVSALAVEDLLATISYIGFYPQQWIRGEDTISLPACGVYVFMSLFYGICELYFMAEISLDRYIACCRPLQYSNIATPRRSAFVIGFSWIFTATLSLCVTLGCKFYGRNSYTDHCQIEFTVNQQAIYCTAVMFILALLPCSMTIAICQYKILKQVRKISNRTPANVTSSLQRTASGNSSNKATKTVSLMTGTYVTCWLPYLAVRASGIVVDWEQSYDHRKTIAILRVITYHTLLISKFTNPLIHGVYNLEFRTECGKLFKLSSRSTAKTVPIRNG